MVEIANPIFDIVFKYLMEDESIALTFLSALLKKDVISVEMRRNEYSNQSRDNLSNFRIDFGARVRETEGLPDRFIDSLTHDSIVVQIPRITGRRQNRLERVLSVFDQSLAGDSRQILQIDDSECGNYPELIRIIRRLQSAAANKEIRQNMTVEEEFFSAIDNRDAAIASRDATIASRDATIASHEATIASHEATISSQKSMLADSCRLLLQSGRSMEEIAKSLKIDLQRLTALLNE